jgi:hypothetical protein
MGNYRVQIPDVAAAVARRIAYFHGNLDLAIGSWTLGENGAQTLFAAGGMAAVRGALLSKRYPNYGTVGEYIGEINKFLGP